MSRSAGTMTLAAGNPVVTGTTISSTVYNNTMNDIANEITNSIARDGTSPPTANLPMGGFKHTGCADGSASTDSATVGQIGTLIASLGHAATSKTPPVDADEIPLFDSAASYALKKLTWANLKLTLGSWLQIQTTTAFTTGGTSSAFTVTATPALTTYTNARLAVTLNAAPTGSPTMNWNGLGVKNFKYKDSTGTKQFVTSTQAPNGHLCDLWYDGTDVLLQNVLPTTVSAATTSAAGIVELLTTTELKTGTDTTRTPTADAMLNAQGFTAYFESAAQTITSAGALTIAHGLGRTPVMIQCYLKAVNAVSGYSVNDLTPCISHTHDAAAGRGQAIVMDSTNINVRFSNVAGVFNVCNKTTGAIFVITNTDWNVVYRVWA